jgi:hypothetical protein
MHLHVALSYKLSRVSIPSYPADFLAQAFDMRVVTPHEKEAYGVLAVEGETWQEAAKRQSNNVPK